MSDMVIQTAYHIYQNMPIVLRMGKPNEVVRSNLQVNPIFNGALID